MLNWFVLIAFGALAVHRLHSHWQWRGDGCSRCVVQVAGAPECSASLAWCFLVAGMPEVFVGKTIRSVQIINLWQSYQSFWFARSCLSIWVYLSWTCYLSWCATAASCCSSLSWTIPLGAARAPTMWSCIRTLCIRWQRGTRSSISSPISSYQVWRFVTQCSFLKKIVSS